MGLVSGAVLGVVWWVGIGLLVLVCSSTRPMVARVVDAVLDVVTVAVMVVAVVVVVWLLGGGNI